jgi:uncharacterized membrane protein (UPF0127 family)
VSFFQEVTMRRLLLAGMGVGLAAMIASTGCERMQTAATGAEGQATMPTAEQEGSGMQAQAGTMATVVVAETPFTVEIAETDAQKAHGLMGRESLPENAGMWFVFDEPVQEQFWMKDTLIPLDMIFVGDDMKIVSIVKNAKPLSEELISSTAPYKFVLEVNGGLADKYGFKVGDAVEKRIGPQ